MLSSKLDETGSSIDSGDARVVLFLSFIVSFITVSRVCSQRRAGEYWFDQDCIDYPLPVFREVLKNQFVKNAHVNDLRIIDRKVEETWKVGFGDR